MNTENTTQELSKIEKSRLANRLSYQRNKEKRSKATLDYYYKNRDKCKQNYSDYYYKNREHLNQNACEYIRKKREVDPYFRLVVSLRARLHGALKNQLAGKSQRTLHLIGCSVDELIKHIEERFQPGMSWDNYSMHGWHVDHIVPCSAFDLTDLEQQKKCFHYTNLQPLWARDNLVKGDRLY